MRITEVGATKADRAKSWLWRYRKAKQDYHRYKTEYEALCAVQESVSALQYTGMPGGSGKITDLSTLMVVREGLLGKLIAKQKEMSDACAEVIEMAERLDGAGRDVIILRYVRLPEGRGAYSFAEIGRMIGYSTSQIKRYHSKALQQIEKMIPDEPK